MKYDFSLIRSYSSEDFEKKYTYEKDDLGLNITGDTLIFKLWSPVAKNLIINIYESGDKNNDDIICSFDMEKEDKGVWCKKLEKKYIGKYYTYTIEYSDGDKNEFVDPYARSCGVNGNRGMIIDLSVTNPEGWEEDKNPNMNLSYCDSIIYELHVRDFSSLDSSGIENKGKFLGLVEENTTLNGEGKIKTGIDYLKDLGITHLHLLPFNDYEMLDESKPYDKNEYNWGYDPKNYNIPEGSYSTNPFDGEVRIKELKETIKKLHENNISVVMDVVYNHTFNELFSYNVAVPGYFYRFNDKNKLSNGSGCGNDVASERSMVSKFIVDSVLYWAKEFHMDGFRFDLVGLLDVDTINKIREEVDKLDNNIMLYGEGWLLKTDLSKDVYLTNQDNAEMLNNFALFNDDFRDLIKGSVFDEEEKGYISGEFEDVDNLKNNLLGLPEWSTEPKMAVNYTSCHDNYTLYDKICMSNPEITRDKAIEMNKLAASLAILSLGIPFLHAGEELLREKRENGEFVSDSVRSSDEVNGIRWENLEDKEIKKLHDYYKGLIEFRKNNPILHIGTKEEVEEYAELLDLDNNKAGFALSDKNEMIFIMFNPNETKEKVSLQLKDYSKKMDLENITAYVYVDKDNSGNNPIKELSLKNNILECEIDKISACVIKVQKK